MCRAWGGTIAAVPRRLVIRPASGGHNAFSPKHEAYKFAISSNIYGLTP